MHGTSEDGASWEQHHQYSANRPLGPKGKLNFSEHKCYRVPVPTRSPQLATQGGKCLCV